MGEASPKEGQDQMDTMKQRVERLNLQSRVVEATEALRRPYTIEYTDGEGARVTHECSLPLRRVLKLALDDVREPLVRDASGVVVCEGEAQAEALADHISTFELTDAELGAALAFVEE